MPRSFSLGDHFDSFVNAQVKGGRYNNASEVVREALRLLEDQEKLLGLKITELRRLVDEGRASRLSHEDGEDFLNRLEARYRVPPKKRRRA